MLRPHVCIAWLCFAGAALAQAPNSQPNPYQTAGSWLQIPAGRAWGSAAAVHVTPNGHIWVGERCGANDCANSNLAPIFEFDASGKMLQNFGAGMFNFPHGIFVDQQGNVWVTDSHGGNGKGQQVIKFDSRGKELMRLGKAGVAGNGPDTFNQPADVLVAPNGDIFVADGHDPGTNARIVKFAKDGKFIKAFGELGSAPGQVQTPHSLAMDSQGRLFVADRGNNRVQIFDQDGKSLAVWTQFSRPSGVWIDAKDNLYVSDSESNEARHPGGWQRGVRVGSARTGVVRYFIPDSTPAAQQAGTSSGEGVAAGPDGVIYSAEVGPKGDLKKYTMKK
jgi:sugar lactone lactonase YvrE